MNFLFSLSMVAMVKATFMPQSNNFWWVHFAKIDFKGQSITLDNFVDRNRPEASLNRLSDSKISIDQFKISYCPYSRLKSTAYTISMTYPRYTQFPWLILAITFCILYIFMECMSNRRDSHRIILHKTFRNVKVPYFNSLNQCLCP